jgi:diguanylate cyclase (GGDEF)-like protein
MAVRFLRNASLRTTILLLVTGTVAALTLLMLASVLLVARRAGSQAVARDFRATGEFLTQLLAEKTRSMTAVCTAMGGQPTFVAYLLNSGGIDAREHWLTVSDIAEQVRAGVGADTVVVTDQDGREIGESRVPSPRRTDRSRTPGIAAALDGKTWQGVVAENGQLTVAVAVPVFAPGGEYVRGTFYAASALDDRLARALHAARGCDVAFVSDGRLVASSLPLARLPALPEPQDSGAAVIPAPMYSEGERYLASYQRVRITNEGQPVAVLLFHRYTDATALTRALEAGLIAPAALTLGLAVLLGMALARRLAMPLDGVVAAARLLREGRWPERLAGGEGGNEIGLLRSAFNEMTMSLRAAQERLLSLIDTDPLTGLDNHRRFQERLAQEVQRADASGEPLSLLLVGIDHFQAFNQGHGHAEGDGALRDMADLIRGVLPPVAVAARYAGDEFAVLLPRTDPAGALEMAERIRAAVNTDKHWALTVSVGYAARGEGTSERESLALAAELALTQAKHLGRDRVCGFDAVACAVGTTCGAGGARPYHLQRFLRDGSLSTIQALAAAVDAKDPYTQGHSRRVADLAQLLAEHLHLSPEQVDRVFTAATLHDVGKIGIPDRVLQKAERLDREEQRLMETHPVLGEVIVGKVPQLGDTLAGVRSHHERWDGRGYPDGLSGEQIPLDARILALADTFDAMTSDRPYRRGLPVEVALQEIVRNAGTQFDPKLAPLFVDVLRERERQQEGPGGVSAVPLAA